MVVVHHRGCRQSGLTPRRRGSVSQEVSGQDLHHPAERRPSLAYRRHLTNRYEAGAGVALAPARIDALHVW